MRLSIIGLGLIGGSMSIDLRKRGFASHITGVDSNKLHANTALNIGIVDQIEELDVAITNSDIIILAIPAINRSEFYSSAVSSGKSSRLISLISCIGIKSPSCDASISAPSAIVPGLQNRITPNFVNSSIISKELCPATAIVDM